MVVYQPIHINRRQLMKIGNKLKLFNGGANLELTKAVASKLDINLTKGRTQKFPDGETSIDILESVRGSDVFIIQSTYAPVNENIMELLIFIDALKRASAWRVNAVIPYFGYARQDKKMQARDPITAKLVANLLETAGIDRVITIDLHAGQIQGFFDVPVDHLTAIDILADHLRAGDLSNSVVVSPDVGRATDARRLANSLGLELAILYKRRTSPTETAVSHVIGDVIGKRPIMIDDMISTAGTIHNSVKALVDLGVKKDIKIVSTHPVFTKPALERLAHPAISEVVVTDTIPYTGDLEKVKVLSVAPLLAKAIENIHSNKSVSKLFSTKVRGEANPL